MTKLENRLFCVIDVTDGNQKEWAVYVPTEPSLRMNLNKLKKLIDLYLEDLPE